LEFAGSVLTSAIKSLTEFTEFAEKIKKPSDLCERIRVSANGRDFHVADDRINPEFASILIIISTSRVMGVFSVQERKAGACGARRVLSPPASP